MYNYFVHVKIFKLFRHSLLTFKIKSIAIGNVHFWIYSPAVPLSALLLGISLWVRLSCRNNIFPPFFTVALSFYIVRRQRKGYSSLKWKSPLDIIFFFFYFDSHSVIVSLLLALVWYFLFCICPYTLDYTVRLSRI